jgi:hypothetical protein
MYTSSYLWWGLLLFNDMGYVTLNENNEFDNVLELLTHLPSANRSKVIKNNGWIRIRMQQWGSLCGPQHIVFWISEKKQQSSC